MKPTWFTTDPGVPPSPFGPEVQVDETPGKHHQRVSADHEHLAPMPRKSFLFASTSLETMCQWPMVTPGVVEWGRLRGRGAYGQRRCEQ